MASLICAALTNEPPWTCVCPTVPEVERLLLGALDSEQQLVMVLEDDEDDDDDNTIVSAAVWDTSREKEKETPTAGSHAAAISSGRASHSCNPDAAKQPLPDKLASLVSAGREGKGARLTLSLLATRPDRQRRGHGKTLASWGVDRARKQRVPVRVQAASRAYVLFSGMGFTDCGLLSVPMDTDGYVKTLVLEPKPSPRRLSRLAELLSRYGPHR
ncbi:hypothetical protein XA68_12661 [Ophiocordyceps unilateralis]|uniref:N-acetyltransferase domain-containing protein n=1 Tax=Ophiocordyceps unilateralis TaxID=268505 RepID=A0A2A9PE63_OPHUN|nr:hypothetical protein XA68_12661 [Ophiocordyceps unilateralis]